MLQLLAVLSLMAALLGLFLSSSFSASAHAPSSLSAASSPLGAPSAWPAACGDQPGPRSASQAAAPTLRHPLFSLDRSTSATIELTATLLGLLSLPVSRAALSKGRGSSMGPRLAASLAILLFLVTPVAPSPSAILDSANTPSRDFFSPASSASLTLWLQGSRSMPIHSGALRGLLSPSRLALARTASRAPNHYAGHTLTIGAQSAVITGYSGDANGDGDLDDEGDAEVWLDRALPIAPPATGRQYRITAGYSVVSDDSSEEGDSALLHWVNAATPTEHAGTVWAALADNSVEDVKHTRVSLGPGAPTRDLAGLTLIVGGEARVIVEYDVGSRVAEVRPAFSRAAAKGEGVRVVRYGAAGVEALALEEGHVAEVSKVSPAMRFRLAAGVRHGPAGDLTGLSMSVFFNTDSMSVSNGNVREDTVILSHSKDGFVSVSRLSRAATVGSSYVVHRKRPTVLPGASAGLNGFPAVALDGVSSFLTADSAVRNAASGIAGSSGSGPARPFGFRGNTTVTYLHQANCSAASAASAASAGPQGYEPDAGNCSAAAHEAEWLGRAAAPRTSLTILSVVRAHAPAVLAGGKVASGMLVAGTLAPPVEASAGGASAGGAGVYPKGVDEVVLGGDASEREDAYNGMPVRLMLTDGTALDRVIVSYSRARAARLNESVPMALAAKTTRFFVFAPPPSPLTLTLSEDSSFIAGAYVGMYLTVAEETRVITHHGAAPSCSSSNGRVVTLAAPLSAAPAPPAAYTITARASQLSLGAAQGGAGVDVGHDIPHGGEEARPERYQRAAVLSASGAVGEGRGDAPGRWEAEADSDAEFAPGEWRIEAVVVDAARGTLLHYAGGLTRQHRVAATDLTGSAAEMVLDSLTLGARRSPRGGGSGFGGGPAGTDWAASNLWRGDVGEVLVYRCDAPPLPSSSHPSSHPEASPSTSEAGPSGKAGKETDPSQESTTFQNPLLGCTTPADLDRLGTYLAGKFGLPWAPAAGPTDGAILGPASTDRDAALAVARGEAGSGAVPLVRSVSPASAPAGGGAQRITVHGRHFGEGEGVQVLVGGRACTDVRVTSPTSSSSSSPPTASSVSSSSAPEAGPSSSASSEDTIECTAPSSSSSKGKVGRADVTVLVYGVAGIAHGAYRYGAPSLTALSPSRVRAAGGAVVTLIGTNFLSSDGGVAVTIDAHQRVACVTLQVLSDEALRCTLPQLYSASARFSLSSSSSSSSSSQSHAASARHTAHKTTRAENPLNKERRVRMRAGICRSEVYFGSDRCGTGQ